MPPLAGDTLRFNLYRIADLNICSIPPPQLLHVAVLRYHAAIIAPPPPSPETGDPQTVRHHQPADHRMLGPVAKLVLYDLSPQQNFPPYGVLRPPSERPW